MTRFAVTIWAYQQTGKATILALMGFFNIGAYVLASPLAGVLIDRCNRKWVVALADLGAGMGLMFACTCLLGTLTCLVGYLVPAVGTVDEEAPEPHVEADPARLRS
jgi:MFS family permease